VICKVGVSLKQNILAGSLRSVSITIYAVTNKEQRNYYRYRTDDLACGRPLCEREFLHDFPLP
jgi:hypothetical protein